MFDFNALFNSTVQLNLFFSDVTKFLNAQLPMEQSQTD